MCSDLAQITPYVPAFSPMESGEPCRSKFGALLFFTIVCWDTLIHTCSHHSSKPYLRMIRWSEVPAHVFARRRNPCSGPSRTDPVRTTSPSQPGPSCPRPLNPAPARREERSALRRSEGEHGSRLSAKLSAFFVSAQESGSEGLPLAGEGRSGA